MNVRAIAWDVDGTLVDSEPLHHRALLAGSAHFGVDLSDLPDEAFRGVHMGDVWKILQPRLPTSLAEAEWLTAINHHYVNHRHELAPVPQAVDTIRALAEMGLPQVCVSNSARMIVDSNLDALGVARYMAFSISLDDVVHGKPDPWPYAEACRRLGAAPATVLAIEDSQTGITSALAAGLRCAALGFDDGAGYHGISDLHEVLRIARHGGGSSDTR
ncbi:MAG: HAD family phosphatase [Aestuariivirga sp.]|uniref:HAD family hydrolase n=1 Tax=Aestuariivirga sp. TaxID=2650926 RepID=UPI003016E337